MAVLAGVPPEPDHDTARWRHAPSFVLAQPAAELPVKDPKMESGAPPGEGGGGEGEGGGGEGGGGEGGGGLEAGAAGGETVHS